MNHCSTKIPEYDLLNSSDELWMRFNLILNKIDFDKLFENHTASEMVDIFLNKIENLVMLIFDKKTDAKYLRNQRHFGFKLA